MNVAIIGSRGHMGQFHTKIVSSLMHGVIEIDTVLDQSDAEVLELLDQADTAIIASPTPTHHDWAQLLISRGIPTLIEKPIARTVSEAEFIQNAADFNGVPVAVGYLRRYNDAWRGLAAEMRGPGRFRATAVGRLVGTEYGGVGLDLGSHYLDLVLNKWPNATIRVLVYKPNTARWAVYDESTNVSGEITVYYDPEAIRSDSEWTWVGDDGTYGHANLATQKWMVSKTYGSNRWHTGESNQLEEQWFDFMDLIRGNASRICTIEQAIEVMKAVQR